jgi:tetratricopeptide (TPR) repeat protein
MLGLPSLQAQVADPPAKEQTVLTEARGLLDAGKIEAAIELLRNGSKNAADKAEISYLLGLAYHQKRDYVHAVEYLSAAVNRLPGTDGKYYQAIQLLGQSHYLLGRYQ